jgi:hypothetical protein
VCDVAAVDRRIGEGGPVVFVALDECDPVGVLPMTCPKITGAGLAIRGWLDQEPVRLSA